MQDFSGLRKNITPGITDKKFIEIEIARWITSKERAQQINAERYYEGKQDILTRKRMVIGEDGKLVPVDNLPNNRIVDNQYAKMVDQKANYLLGKPLTFDSENDAYGKALSAVFTPKVQRQFKLAAEKAIIGGKCFIMPYYNDNGQFSFELFPAHEILPFWADTSHTELDCAVHFFQVYEYKNDGTEKIVDKAEIFHAGGIERFIWENGSLIYDNDAPSGSYITVSDGNSKQKPYNWERLPLICFKRNHGETPLLNSVKCLQDAYNLILSDFVNGMEENVHNTVIVLHNYDGENLGEFRRNLATYGAVKVRSVDGVNGDVKTLEIIVNAENYKTVMKLLKESIIENARGYDAKDERLSGTPNQMNIQSMYSDIDLDANGMETEFQAAFEDLMFFVNAHLANTGAGNFMGEPVKVIFNRDILINESEAINNCGKSQGIISKETIVKQHPWVDDPVKELERVESEKAEQAQMNDEYSAAAFGILSENGAVSTNE